MIEFILFVMGFCLGVYVGFRVFGSILSKTLSEEEISTIIRKIRLEGENKQS